MLIHASNVSFVPQQPSSGITFACERYALQVDDVFDVLTNDTVGLYTGDTAQILTTAFSSTMLTYSLTGRHSNISIADGDVMLEQINVAIVALISKHYN